MFKKERLFNYRTYSDPFPVMVIQNFLNKEESELAAKILKESEFDEFVRGGRKNIRKGSKEFKKFIKKNKIFRELYDFFNQEDLFLFLLKKLETVSKDSKSNFTIKNRPIKFKKNYYEYKRSVHNKNLIKKIFNFLWLQIPKKVKRLFSFYFFEVNFSLAQKGYTLPTHRDKNTRILVFLLYLNNLENDSGGCLEVYRSKNNSVDLKISQPKQEDISIAHKFRPEPGKLVVFLSNPLSFHNVEKIKKDSVVRYFCYGGYTSNIDVDWAELH